MNTITEQLWDQYVTLHNEREFLMDNDRMLQAFDVQKEIKEITSNPLFRVLN